MKIVLVGAGGIGVSAIGFLLKNMGYDVIGIDTHQNQITDKLEAQGVQIIIGQGKYNPKPDELVIYSQAAIRTKEVTDATNKMSYAEFVGAISSHMHTIAVAGTHGKSTTSAMCIYTLSKLFPEFGLGITGTLMGAFDSQNFYVNQNHSTEIKEIFDDIVNKKPALDKKNLWFVIEADEYNRHFLQLHPDIGLITNIELDHSDIYPSFDIYMGAFISFVQKVNKKVFGLRQSLSVGEIRRLFRSKTTLLDTEIFDFQYIFGHHNDMNATLVLNVAKYLGLDSVQTKDTINQFPGIWRRMEMLGSTQRGALLYTDYAHHPSELQAVLGAMRQKYPNKNIIAVFQPHQARRVLQFWDNFPKALGQADEVLIYDIYMARENLDQLKKQFKKDKIGDISTANDLGQAFAQSNNGTYVGNFDELLTVLKSKDQTNIIVCMSAGNLDYQLRQQLKNI